MGRTTIGPTRIALAVGLKVLETAAARLGNRNMTKEHHTDVCVDDLGGFEIHRTAFLGVSFTGSRFEQLIDLFVTIFSVVRAFF